MNQRKVATRRGGISRKKEAVAKYMAEHLEGCTPKMISLGTGLNINTVKSILPKLQNITTIARGLYKVLNRGDPPYSSDGELSTWNFHNLVLTFPVEHCNFKEFTESYDLIKFSFSITDDLCTVRVSTDHPLNVSSICLIYAFIKYRSGEMELTMSQVRISTIEFNKDHTDLRFDGVKCITLDNLITHFKLYQKQVGLRKEHKTKLKFRVSDLVDMLTNSPQNLDLSMKLSDQRDQLKKLTAQSMYNTAQLTKIMEAR